jgi:hypothetical protein
VINTKSAHITTSMIYGGTFLVSVLSFITTYQGLCIFLDKWLAAIGSLGLQTAMLGIAWNLMRFRVNRLMYTAVFMMVACFSIFFSYVNFNTRLKGSVRSEEVRASYAEAARPMLAQYASLTKYAVVQGKYQAERLSALRAMEESRGWATIIDEGSNDPFLQSVIEGARRTVESWSRTQGTDYRQGSGRGIILDYLGNWDRQIRGSLEAVEEYASSLDSIGVQLRSDVPVADQYDRLNWASVHFPIAEYTRITSEQPSLPQPPFTAGYVERPTTGQQALNLVIADLYRPDRLTLFSLIFAFVIDFLVIVMALSGSHVVSNLDFVLAKLEQDAAERLKKLSTDDPDRFSKSLQDNLERLRRASEYGRDLEEVLHEVQSTRGRIRLNRGEEVKSPSSN